MCKEPLIMKTDCLKRDSRKKATAEDFTPLWLVNQMLDKLLEYSPTTFSDPTKTYLDPACGNGNMLIEVLKRKLQYTTPVQAISTIYGCDIMHDNIIECRLRLLKVVIEHAKQQGTKDLYNSIVNKTPSIASLFQDDIITIIKLLGKNIVCTPLKTYPNGSLDYLSLPDNKTFNKQITDEFAIKLWNSIQQNNMLDSVSIEEQPKSKSSKPNKPSKEIKPVKTTKTITEKPLLIVDSDFDNVEFN